MLQPAPGAAELDPDALFAAGLSCLVDCVRAVADTGGMHVEAVCLSSILGSVMALGRDGTPLTKAYTWADLRCSPDCLSAKAALDEEALYQATGCQIHSHYVGPKLAWLRRTNPETMRQASRFVSTKSYVLGRMTGELAVDRSIASGSGLVDLPGLKWSPAWLSYLGVRQERLGEIVEPTTAFKMRPEIARAAGLDPGTPIYIGAADGMLSNLGVGAVRRGQYAAMLATSGAVRTIRADPALHSLRKTWAIYLADGMWVCGAAISSGGIVYRWVRDQFFAREVAELEAAGEDGYEAVNRAAAQSPPGAAGLLLLPYLAGERSPHWNVDARGVLAGLNLSHDRRDIARAAMEGISLHFTQAARALFEVCGAPDEIRVTGGFRKSNLWVQTLANTLGQKLALPPDVDASGLGAALLAMRARGVFESLLHAGQVVPVLGYVAPEPRLVKQYEVLYDLHDKLYAALAPSFAEIASSEIDRN